ncbi:MAG TPA: molecular chaperone DnaJ, partial [Crenotrichaceae bacterium]|nr:molecular chaperone DnaJ [Crenotrichaceae bacterium]
SAQMSVEQAYKILGLRKNASRKEIIAAHRRLMQKAHPDHGGSDELAAQINAARDVLLK